MILIVISFSFSLNAALCCSCCRKKNDVVAQYSKEEIEEKDKDTTTESTAMADTTSKSTPADDIIAPSTVSKGVSDTVAMLASDENSDVEIKKAVSDPSKVATYMAPESSSSQIKMEEKPESKEPEEEAGKVPEKVTSSVVGIARDLMRRLSISAKKDKPKIKEEEAEETKETKDKKIIED